MEKLIHGISFNTHTYPGGYQIHFDTDSIEAYEAVQIKIRDIMGHGKPQTKGDEIRAMTDEELATNFASRCCPKKDEFYDCGKLNGKSFSWEDCRKCWLKWLKSPATKEGE